MQRPIYLDNNATTRVDPRVLERMLPYFCDDYGNAASRSHAFGWKAEQAVDEARGQVAALLGGTAREIVFTSGATEANNLALFGVARAYAARGDHIVTQVTEHKAVLDVCRALERQAGVRVTYLPVDGDGRVDVAAVEAAIEERTVLVSIMHGNNEIGTLQEIAAIGAVCHRRGVLFHSDMAQTAGKLPIDVNQMGVDLASVSAHKFYGPKGVGALFVRRRDPRVSLEPLLHGGGHERGWRSGTLNVPAIVGLGEACRLAAGPEADVERERVRVRELREALAAGICGRLEGVVRNGHEQERLPGNLHLSFAGIDGEALLLALRDVALSSGSACTSATMEPSHVLRAIGLDAALAHASVRFGIGRFNTREEIDFVVEAVVEQVNTLRALHRPRGGHRRARRGARSDAC